MKMLKHISFIAAAAALLTGCYDDDKIVYNDENAVPATLQAVGDLTLTAETAGNETVTFNWTAAEFGFQAAPTYNLEIDLAGKSFANAYTIASTTGTSATVKASELNSAITIVAKKYDGTDATATNSYEMRVVATLSNTYAPVYSAAVAANITGYAGRVEYPKVWVIGDYCGWDHTKTLFLYDYSSSATYTGLVFFDGKAANGFKLTDAADWNNGNYGTDGSDIAAEQSKITLINDGGSGNIGCYAKNFYVLQFGTSSMELSVLNSFNTMGIVGTINGWGESDDVAMEYNAEDQTLSAIVSVGADDEIKFRADADWGYNLGGADGVLAAGGDNIKLPAGTWRVSIDINNPAEMTYTYEEAVALDPSLIAGPAIATALEAETNIAKSSTIGLEWSAVDFGGQEEATVNYTVEASADADFTSPVVLATTKETSASVGGEALLAAFAEAEAGMDIYFRVSAAVAGVADTFTSAAVSSKFTIVNAVALPTEMYMIGSMCEWSWDNAIAFAPVHSAASGEGVFWTIAYIDANAEFKFCAQKAWDGDFGASAVEANEYTAGTDNVVMASAGYYQIVVRVTYTDDTRQTTACSVSIGKPNVYLMGDCSNGGWSGGVATDKFTVDDDGKVLTSPALAGSGALRMYVEVPGCDWWGSEFNVYDGQIVLRGNGGDQEAVQAEAGQTVTLDFTSMTGTIQ